VRGVNEPGPLPPGGDERSHAPSVVYLLAPTPGALLAVVVAKLVAEPVLIEPRPEDAKGVHQFGGCWLSVSGTAAGAKP